MLYKQFCVILFVHFTLLLANFFILDCAPFHAASSFFLQIYLFSGVSPCRPSRSQAEALAKWVCKRVRIEEGRASPRNAREL